MLVVVSDENECLTGGGVHPCICDTGLIGRAPTCTDTVGSFTCGCDGGYAIVPTTDTFTCRSENLSIHNRYSLNMLSQFNSPGSGPDKNPIIAPST